MAGIGFELRKLTRRDDLLGILQGTAHSALAATGPWLFTSILLGGIILIGSGAVSREESFTFQLIVIYNFAFSLVMSAPVVMLLTRLLADAIYEKRVEPAPRLFLTGLGFLFAVQAVVVLPFYLHYTNLGVAARLGAVANFFLVTGIWAVSVFLTALKDYKSITTSFFMGVVIAFSGCYYLAPKYSVAGMLFGFDVGLGVIFFSLAARLFVEYPYPVDGNPGSRRNAARYWEIALGGLIYNLAIWIDKWIMWFAPQHKTLPSRMVSYPDYDSGMFLAYLSIVPAMAIFVFSIETDFFEKYLRFYREIQRHASYGDIERDHQGIIQSLLRSFRNFVVFQGSISLVTILLAPKLFEVVGISFTQLGIFRFGVLGALFQALFLFMMIILSYFDLRQVVLTLQTVFLASNVAFTLASFSLGFAWYGHGYFMASLLTFLITVIVTIRVVAQLPYQAFVRTNLSVR